MRLLSCAPRGRRSSGGLSPAAAAPRPAGAQQGPARGREVGSGQRCQGGFIGIHGRVGRAARGAGRGTGGGRCPWRAQMPG